METNDNIYIGRTIPSEKVGLIPESAKWLSGEAGGAWFDIKEEGKNYRIKRFSLEGEVDCDRLFILENKEEFNPNQPFEIKHTSHCAIVRVHQNGTDIKFVWTGK